MSSPMVQVDALTTEVKFKKILEVKTSVMVKLYEDYFKLLHGSIYMRGAQRSIAENKHYLRWNFCNEKRKLPIEYKFHRQPRLNPMQRSHQLIFHKYDQRWDIMSCFGGNENQLEQEMMNSLEDKKNFLDSRCLSGLESFGWRNELGRGTVRGDRDDLFAFVCKPQRDGQRFFTTFLDMDVEIHEIAYCATLENYGLKFSVEVKINLRKCSDTASFEDEKNIAIEPPYRVWTIGIGLHVKQDNRNSKLELNDFKNLVQEQYFEDTFTKFSNDCLRPFSNEYTVVGEEKLKFDYTGHARIYR